jgi:hypothetical protein
MALAHRNIDSSAAAATAADGYSDYSDNMNPQLFFRYSLQHNLRQARARARDQRGLPQSSSGIMKEISSFALKSDIPDYEPEQMAYWEGEEDETAQSHGHNQGHNQGQSNSNAFKVLSELVHLTEDFFALPYTLRDLQVTLSVGDVHLRLPVKREDLAHKTYQFIHFSIGRVALSCCLRDATATAIVIAIDAEASSSSMVMVLAAADVQLRSIALRVDSGLSDACSR